MKTNLGDYLRACRVSKNLTQKDVAKALGYSTIQHISNVEASKSKPSFKDVKKIAKLIDADASNIYSLMRDMDYERIDKKYKGLI